jgi:hypothetical protein
MANAPLALFIRVSEEAAKRATDFLERERQRDLAGGHGLLSFAFGCDHAFPEMLFIRHNVAISASIFALLSAGRCAKPVYSIHPLETPTPAPTCRASFIWVSHVAWKCHAHGRQGLSPRAARNRTGGCV